MPTSSPPAESAPIRWAVIGAGRFGALHARTLRQMPGVELCALCRRTEGPLAALAAELDVTATHTDYRRVLDDPGVDAVTVATHWEEHFEIAAAALNAGKHVFLEKPIAATNDQAARLVQQSGSGSARLMVGHICRFDPRVLLAKRAIDAGRVGRILSMHARRNLPTAPGSLRLDRIPPLVGDGIHDVDLMNWFTGRRPHQVYARTAGTGQFRYADLGWAMLDYGDDCVGVVETVWCLPKSTPYRIDARMEIVGTDGALYVDCANAGVAIHDADGVEQPDTVYWPDVGDQTVGALRAELDHFAAAIRDDHEVCAIAPAEAADALAVVLAAEESAKTGSPVDVGSSG